MTTTPSAAGFTMPAEHEPHSGCLMAWPSRAELWGERLEAATHEYAAVARTIAAFEPVTMVCNPGLAADVRNLCGDGVTPVEIPINDSWIRDSGPAFVRNPTGISHSPDESAPMADCLAGVEALADALQVLV